MRITRSLAAIKMERRLIIHVGPHKTASTYIQKRLRENTKLLEELKIGIPRQPISHAKHRDLAYKMNSKKKNFWGKELEPLRDKNHVLISSEAFCNRILTNNNLDFLLDISKSYDLKLTFVYFVRDQVDLMTSQYCHGIRRFYRSCSFKDFCRKKLRKDRNHHSSTYNLADRFESHLDRTDVDFIFIPLTRKKDPFLEMASKLGWPNDTKWETLDEGESRNEQPGCKGIWLSRAAFEICEEVDYPIKNLKKKGKIIRNIAIKKGWHNDRFCGYTDALYKKVKNYYSQSNQRFSLKVWGEDWDKIVETKQKPLQIYRGPRSSKEYKEVLSVLKKAFKKMGWSTLEKENLVKSLSAIRPKLSRFT
ncbi:hypothetical protein [Synechococcus sp. CC9616]|uniref:hypothetical protein n=1 Tax=Synechococcus sp. CC9616 TaxID=110663 RepID=UPI00048FC37B|nr:hypothetical protein [Synechococcus sp. CC9616]